MAVPLLDLKRQYMSIKDELDKAVLNVLNHGLFILGPEVTALEEKIAAIIKTLATMPTRIFLELFKYFSPPRFISAPIRFARAPGGYSSITHSRATFMRSRYCIAWKRP